MQEAIYFSHFSNAPKTAASSFAIGVNCLLILRGFLGAFRSRPLQGFASLKLQDGGSEAPETLCLEPGAGSRETRAEGQEAAFVGATLYPRRLGRPFPSPSL